MKTNTRCHLQVEELERRDAPAGINSLGHELLVQPAQSSNCDFQQTGENEGQFGCQNENGETGTNAMEIQQTVLITPNTNTSADNVSTFATGKALSQAQSGMGSFITPNFHGTMNLNNGGGLPMEGDGTILPITSSPPAKNSVSDAVTYLNPTNLLRTGTDNQGTYGTIQNHSVLGMDLPNVGGLAEIKQQGAIFQSLQEPDPVHAGELGVPGAQWASLPGPNEVKTPFQDDLATTQKANFEREGSDKTPVGIPLQEGENLVIMTLASPEQGFDQIVLDLEGIEQLDAE